MKSRHCQLNRTIIERNEAANESALTLKYRFPYDDAIQFHAQWRNHLMNAIQYTQSFFSLSSDSVSSNCSVIGFIIEYIKRLQHTNSSINLNNKHFCYLQFKVFHSLNWTCTWQHYYANYAVWWPSIVLNNILTEAKEVKLTYTFR